MSSSQNPPQLYSGDNATSAALRARVACPICNTEGAPRVFLAKDRVHHLSGTFGIHRCAHCHAHFVQPSLSEEGLAGYYPEEYKRYRVGKSLSKKNYARWQRFVLEHRYGYPKSHGTESNALQRAVAFLLSWFTAKGVIPYRGDGRILDIGAGSGSYLYRLKQWGWEAYGVEPRATGARQAQSLGLAVHHGSLAEARLPNSFFDVVRLNNVLDHLPDPLTVFEEIDRILKPNGLVYVTVPNTESLVFWLFRENWYALDAPRHVIFYSPVTLNTLCDATGFELACMRFTAGPHNFVRSVPLFFEEGGRRWPVWIRRIHWERSKFVRRALKPLFFFVDVAGYGDVLHATLRKKPSLIITAAKVFEKPHSAGRVVNSVAR